MGVRASDEGDVITDGRIKVSLRIWRVEMFKLDAQLFVRGDSFSPTKTNAQVPLLVCSLLLSGQAEVWGCTSGATVLL